MNKLALILILIIVLFGNGCATIYKETMNVKYVKVNIADSTNYNKVDKGFLLLDMGTIVAACFIAPHAVLIPAAGLAADIITGALFK